MKLATKIVFLVCLVSVTVLPALRWIIDPSIDMAKIATFVIATAGPLGILTGAMAAKSIAKKSEGDK